MQSRHVKLKPCKLFSYTTLLSRFEVHGKRLFPERSNETDTQCTNVQLYTTLWSNKLDYRSITKDQLSRHLNRSKAFLINIVQKYSDKYTYLLSRPLRPESLGIHKLVKPLSWPAPLLVKAIKLVMRRTSTYERFRTAVVLHLV